MLELDIVLQRFIDNDYKQLSTQQLQEFERLLDLPDQDLWSLITGRQVTSDENLSTVLNLLQRTDFLTVFMKFINVHFVNIAY